MSEFKFKHFTIHQQNSALKVGTDAMLLGSFLPKTNQNYTLEIGAGTGVISAMFSQNNNNSFIDAIEIDEQSFLDLKTNCEKNHFKNITPILADFFSYEFSKKYSLIFSNPPFFANQLKSNKEKNNLAKHDINFNFPLFFEKIKFILESEGELVIIIPYIDSERLISCAESEELFLKKRINIYSKQNKLNRLILFFSKKPNAIFELNFLVRNNDGKYSDEYKELTKDFHDREL